MLKTYQQNTGYSHPHKNPEVYNQMIQNNIEKYGVEHLWCDYEWKKKKMLQKYGVENYAQTGLINGYKWYEYELPSGRIVKYQGYEGKYIPILLRKYGEENICFETHEIPKIKYTFNNKNKVYFPDFYIPKDNLIIEIKSNWTLRANKELNEAKFKAVIDNGFNFKLKIYS